MNTHGLCLFIPVQQFVLALWNSSPTEVKVAFPDGVNSRRVPLKLMMWRSDELSEYNESPLSITRIFMGTLWKNVQVFMEEQTRRFYSLSINSSKDG